MVQALSDVTYKEYKIKMEYHKNLDGFRAIKFVFDGKNKKQQTYIQKLVQSGNLTAPNDIVIEQLKMDGLQQVYNLIDNLQLVTNVNYRSNFSDLKRSNGRFFLKE